MTIPFNRFCIEVDGQVELELLDLNLLGVAVGMGIGFARDAWTCVGGAGRLRRAGGGRAGPERDQANQTQNEVRAGVHRARPLRMPVDSSSHDASTYRRSLPKGADVASHGRMSSTAISPTCSRSITTGSF